MDLNMLNKKPLGDIQINSNINIGGNIEILPIQRKIGLTIRENGSYYNSEYYFITSEDINITNIDVKAIFLDRKFNPDGYIESEKWVEQNNYFFSISDIKKKYINTDGINKCLHSTTVKLIDSPYVPCNLNLNPLCLRFYIYYVLDGENRRIIADTEMPEENKGGHFIYKSNTYVDRARWPYSLQLDSIYRPFFFNSILLFEDISGVTYGKFYFSIANGCTLRDDSIQPPIYKIGDIKLNINNINLQGDKNINSVYNFNIKNNYRVFSEIEDFHVKSGDNENEKKRKKLLKEAHVRGIRECGTLNKTKTYIQGNNETVNGGIFLPKINNDEYLIPEHTYHTGLTPVEVTYYKNSIRDENKINVYDINSATSFNTLLPLEINFSVSDKSPKSEEYKTIEIKCDYIKFPKIEIEIEGETKKIKIKRNDYVENIYTYLNINVIEPGYLHKLIGELNVYDEISSANTKTDIFSFLYDKHYTDDNKLTIDFTYNKDNGYYEYRYYSLDPIRILSIYHGGYENDDNEKGELLKCVKHTNKLIIMKLYNL